MLVSSVNLSQSFNYAPYLFCKKTVHFRDQFFLYADPEFSTSFSKYISLAKPEVWTCRVCIPFHHLQYGPAGCIPF
jgi:hypothetical protein